jgi:Protein of unknown function (DUF4058)
MSSALPEAYYALLMRGPFLGLVDPWVEEDGFFHQIHAGMITNLARQLSLPLARLGYSISREPSLQVLENRRPDVVMTTSPVMPEVRDRINYAAAAVAVMVEPGIAIEMEALELDAIFIRRNNDHTLITVIEIISPRNKTSLPEMEAYQERRKRLLIGQDINVVEVDITRSSNRLLEHWLTREYPYHTAIFIPNNLTRVLVTAFGEPLKKFALPLRDEVLPVDLQL